MMHKPRGCASPLKFRFSVKATKIWNYRPLSFDIRGYTLNTLEHVGTYVLHTDPYWQIWRNNCFKKT